MFLNESIYDSNLSVTIDLRAPKVLAFFNRENAHFASLDLFKFNDVTNLVSESIQIQR